MRLRPRVDTDVPHLQRIARLTRRVDGYPPHWPPKMVRFPASRGELCAHVVHDDASDEPIGHVALHHAGSDSGARVAAAAMGMPTDQLAVVARLFVHPRHRRTGAARQLLTQATTDATERGLQPILDVWCRLGPAIAFYEQMGWQRAADITIHFASPCSPLCIHDGTSIDSFVYAGPRPT